MDKDDLELLGQLVEPSIRVSFDDTMTQKETLT
jgi:hypothetical protein